MNDRKITTLAASGLDLDDQNRSYAILHGFDPPEALWRKFWAYFMVGGGQGKRRALKGWRQSWQGWVRREELKVQRLSNGRFGENRSPENSSPAKPLPWDRLEKDPFTGRPFCYVAGQRYEFLEAKRIRARNRDRWPFTEAEKEVLWRFGMGEEFSSIFGPKPADPPEDDLFG